MKKKFFFFPSTVVIECYHMREKKKKKKNPTFNPHTIPFPVFHNLIKQSNEVEVIVLQTVFWSISIWKPKL